MISFSSKQMKKDIAIFSCILLLTPISLGAQKPKKEQRCRNNSEQVGECFKVHGRLSAYNGNPSFRIWRIGTARLLGVSDAHAKISQFPSDLEDKLDWGVQVFGDFEVCPFAKETKGAMQFVCIAAASNLVVRDFREPVNKRD